MLQIIIFLSVFYLLLYLYSLKYNNNSIVDLFWWPVFGFIAITTYISESMFTLSQTLVTLLVLAWSCRLFFNILSKKWWNIHEEDPRYAVWREQWNYVKIRSFFQVFALQLLLALIVATPIWIINTSSGFEPSLWLSFVWAAIAFFWLLYESRADGELAGFIKNKESGDIMDSGLRKFHRYPQYFGESVFWLGISIIAAQVSFWSFVWFWVIFLLVRYVSGVPQLEKRYEWNKKFEKYAEKTPIFFPDFRKIFD